MPRIGKACGPYLGTTDEDRHCSMAAHEAGRDFVEIGRAVSNKS